MLQLNEVKFMLFIQARINKAVSSLAQIAIQRMQQNIHNIPAMGTHGATGAMDWREEVASALTFHFEKDAMEVIGKIGLPNARDGLVRKAYLINYGMGLTMSNNNPESADYHNSPYSDNLDAVYTRPNESIYDYEIEQWRRSEAESRYEITHFWQTPTYWFENAMKEVKAEYDMVLKNIFADINLNDFLEMV